MILKYLFQRYQQAKTWKSSTKYIALESDDWGTIRMPDLESFRLLSKSNNKLKDDPYSRFDSLENYIDLERLFDVLTKHNNRNGINPVITANTIVANPLFNRIKETNYNQYFFEPFFKTIENTASGKLTLNAYREGIENKIFYPQLHGREHVNVNLWLHELRSGNKELLNAFELNCFSVPFNSGLNKRNNLMAAFDLCGFEEESEFQVRSIQEAVNIFYQYFNYKSKSFIAPSYIWHRDIESELKNCNIDYLQGISFQFDPQYTGRFKRKLRYSGQYNSYRQIQLVRNVFFEPWSKPDMDWIDDCMFRINKAFESKLPAIVGLHRINFIGSLCPKNASDNLKLFDVLLSKVCKSWPEVEFVTSDQLGEIIKMSKNDSQ